MVSSSLGLAQVSTAKVRCNIILIMPDLITRCSSHFLCPFPKRNADFVHRGHCFLTFCETDKRWKVQSQWPQHATAELREGDQVALFQRRYLGKDEILAARVRSIDDVGKDADIGEDIPIQFDYLGKFKSKQDIFYKAIEPNDTSLMMLEGYEPDAQYKDTIFVPPPRPGEQPEVVAHGESKLHITNIDRSSNRHVLGGCFYFPKENVMAGEPDSGSEVCFVDFQSVALRVRGYSKPFEEWILGICKDANISEADTKLPQYFEEKEFYEHILALIRSACSSPMADGTLLSVSTITEALNFYPSLVEHYKVSSIVLQTTPWNRRRLNRFCTVQIFYTERHQFKGPVSFPLALHLARKPDNVRTFWTTAIVKQGDDVVKLDEMMSNDSDIKVERIDVGHIENAAQLAQSYIRWDDIQHSARPPFFDRGCYCCRDEAEEEANMREHFVNESLTQKIEVASLELDNDEVVHNTLPSVQPWPDRTEFSSERNLLRRHSTLLFEIATPKDFFPSTLFTRQNAASEYT